MPRLILKENSFQFSGKLNLQTHGTTMGAKTAVSFANIFMAYIETQRRSKIDFKPTVWKHCMDNLFSQWDISKPDIVAFFLPSFYKQTYITLLLNLPPKFTETMF